MNRFEEIALFPNIVVKTTKDKVLRQMHFQTSHDESNKETSTFKTKPIKTMDGWSGDCLFYGVLLIKSSAFQH